jgi:transposase
MKEATTPTVGIDIGDTRSHFCMVSVEGEVLERGTVTTDRPALRTFFARLPGRCRVVLEVGTHSPWMYRAGVAAGHEVLVCNARKLKLLTQNERKRDRKDAEILARLGRTSPDLLSLVQHRSEKTQQHLQLIRSRDLLVRSRTRAVTEVRSLVKSLGYRLPKCSAEAFAKTAREALPEEARPATLPVLVVVESLNTQILALEKQLQALAEGDYRLDFQLLSQVSGVGLLTAMSFLLTVEKPGRFKKSRDVAAYLGLVPRSDQSGNTDKQLGISKTGDAHLRRLLVQCASHILRKDSPPSDLKTWAQGLAARGGKNAKKRATIALARKLAVLMHRLWVTGEVYQAQGYAQAA